MPSLQFTRIDLDLIEPDFLARVLEVIARCNARGAQYHAVAGYRTYGAQTALWSQGRVKPGAKVTNAKGGESAHNFGIAIDFVHDSDITKHGLQPDWDVDNYRILKEEAELEGLHSGAGYKDWPHVALAGFVKAQDLEKLHKEWTKLDPKLPDLTRLQMVWKHL